VARRATIPESRLSNLLAAVRVKALLDDGRAIESTDPAGASEFYLAACDAELARRAAAERAGIFAADEIETDVLAEIEQRLATARRRSGAGG
jgi:hypothetical protein